MKTLKAIFTGDINEALDEELGLMARGFRYKYLYEFHRSDEASTIEISYTGKINDTLDKEIVKSLEFEGYKYQQREWKRVLMFVKRKNEDTTKKTSHALPDDESGKDV